MKDSSKAFPLQYMRKKSHSNSHIIFINVFNIYIETCYLFLLCVGQAKDCSDQLMSKLTSLNRRSMDFLSARAFYFHSRIYELRGRLVDVRRWDMYNTLNTYIWCTFFPWVYPHHLNIQHFPVLNTPTVSSSGQPYILKKYGGVTSGQWGFKVQHSTVRTANNKLHSSYNMRLHSHARISTNFRLVKIFTHALEISTNIVCWLVQ